MKIKSKKIIIYFLIFFLIITGGITAYIASHKKNTAKESSDIISNLLNSSILSQAINKPISIVTDPFFSLNLVDNVSIPVPYYHSVNPTEIVSPGEIVITPENLRAQLQLIKDLNYTTLTISDVRDYLINNKPLPEKSILLTFDDGFRDNYTYAFPILKELNMKATIFVITDVIGHPLYLTEEQIKEMSDYGIDIQSHTKSHPYLNKLPYDEQLEELKGSKEKLEAITGKEVFSLAYTYGYYNDDTMNAAKEAGYTLSFTTDLGFVNKGDDPLQLDRIYVSSKYSLEKFKDRLLNTK